MKPTEQLDEFVVHLRCERALAPLTIAAYKHDVEQFAAALGAKPVASATREAITGFLSDLLTRQMDARSVARKLSSIRGFYRFLVAEGIIAVSPARTVRSPKQWKVLPKSLPTARLERLLAPPADSSPASVRDWAILQTLYYSGVRASELVGLRLADVNLEDRTAMVVQGKGGKDRVVPLGRAAGAIEAYLATARPALLKGLGSPFLFVGRRGKPITRQRLAQIVSAAEPTASPHQLRHTLATNLVKRGADLRSVQNILGHEDISTTQVYLHADIDHLRKQFLRFHPRAVQ
jgi:integrase/recombinase XerD